MNEPTQKKEPSSLKARVISGVLLFSGLILILVCGGWVFASVCSLCLIRAIYEELNILTISGHKPVWWVNFVGLIISTPLMYFYSPSLMLPILILLSLCALFTILIRKEPKLLDLFYTLLPLMTIVFPGLCLFSFLTLSPKSYQLYMLVLLFILPISNDFFAFFIGNHFRGPKLCPNVSPKKTISGAIGGLLGGIICSLITTIIFSLTTELNLPNLFVVSIFALIGSVACQMGDLLASLIKRSCNVKDFSNIFPGHGGMLDRIDSILVSVILIYCFKNVLTLF